MVARAPTHERHDGPPGCLGSASGHGQYTSVSLTTKMTCQQPSAGFRGFKLECDVTRWARGIRCDEPLRADTAPTWAASGRPGVSAIAAVLLRAQNRPHRPKLAFMGALPSRRSESGRSGKEGP